MDHHLTTYNIPILKLYPFLTFSGCLSQKLSQIIPKGQNSLEFIGFSFFVRFIFYFNTDRSSVAYRGQSRKEIPPIHIPSPGNFGEWYSKGWAMVPTSLSLWRYTLASLRGMWKNPWPINDEFAQLFPGTY